MAAAFGSNGNSVVANQVPANFQPSAANPLLNPNAPLSGSSLLQAAQALATAQTAPVISGLAQQIGQNNQQSQGAINQVGGYYNQLGQQAQSGVNQEGQIGAGLNSQLANIGQNEQSQLQGIGQNATDSLLKYAPQSDSQNSLARPAFQSIAQEIARQQGLAAQDQGAFQSFGATQGANYQGMAASNLGTNALRGQESLHGLAQLNVARNQPLEARIANEHGLYGADLATALGKLRQQEITNQISRAGLGIKQQTVNASTANNIRTTSTSAANNQRTTAQSNLNNIRTTGTSAANNAANNATRVAIANARATGKALPLGQNRTALTQLGEVQSAIQTWQQQGIKNSKGNVLEPHPTDAQMRQVLGGKYDPVLIQAAFELLGYGAISQGTAAQMNKSGIRGGTFRGQPIKVSTPSVSGAVSGASNLLSGF